MHVDGDILSRLLELGGVSLLRAMLAQEPQGDHRSFDYATAAVRYGRFCELVHDLVGLEGHEDLVQAAVDFMNSLLLPGL